MRLSRQLALALFFAAGPALAGNDPPRHQLAGDGPVARGGEAIAIDFLDLQQPARDGHGQGGERLRARTAPLFENRSGSHEGEGFRRGETDRSTFSDASRFSTPSARLIPAADSE